MKLLILLLAMFTGFGASVRNSTKELEKITERAEIHEYKHHPNLLPVVEIVASPVQIDSLID